MNVGTSPPVVGLSTYRERASWGVWRDEPADVLPSAYARALQVAGAVPLLLPPVDAPSAAAAVVARLDALVISGGADVDPGRYGAAPHERTTGWRPDRDTWEVALLDAAAETDLPVLGICRGMQVMAVRAGGALEQHVPDLVAHETHSPGGAVFGDTDVETIVGSRVRDLVGERLAVRCHHHQSVRTHPGYTAAAYASDGTLEAMEDPARPFWIGVQWHPENREAGVTEDHALFRALVLAAADHAGDASPDRADRAAGGQWGA